MAEKVIIDIEIDGTKSIDTMNKLNEEIKTQKKLLNDAKIGSEEYINANEAINKLTKAHKELTDELTKEERAQKQAAKEIEKAAREAKKAEDQQRKYMEMATMETKSLGDLEAKLFGMKKVYRSMPQDTDKAKESAERFAVAIRELDKVVKKGGEGLGEYQRYVGNYERGLMGLDMSFGQTGNSFADFDRDMGVYQSTAKESTNSTAGFTKGLAGMVAGMTVAIAAAKQIYDAVKESISAFLEADTITNKANKTFGDYADNIFKAAEEVQNSTTIEGDRYVQLATLASKYGAANSQVNQITKDAIALATRFEDAGLGEEEMLKALTKARNGDFTALNKAIPEFKKLETIQEKQALLNQMTAEGWKEQEDALNTYGGQIKQIQNIYGDMQEEVGGQLISGLFGKPEDGKKVADGLNQIMSSLKDSQIIAKYFAQIREQAMVIIEPITKIFKLFDSGANAGDALSGVMSVFLKILDITTYAAKLFWGSIEAIVDVFLGLKKIISDVKNGMFEFQSVLNIVNDVLVDLLTPLTDIFGLTDDMKDFFGVAKRESESLVEVANGLIAVTNAGEKFNTVIETRKKKVEEQTAAIEAVNKAYQDHLNKIRQINEEYEFASYFAKNRIEQWDAEKKRITDLITEYQNFLAADGWTEAELEKFAAYKAQLTTDLETVKNQLFEFNTQVNEMLALNPMQILPSKEQLEKQLEETKATINAGMSAWQSARNEEEKARQQDIKDEAAAWEERRQIAESTAIEFGNIIASSIDETGFNLEKFGKMYTQFILDQMQKVVYASIAEITAREFATKGLAGAVTAGLINASVVAAFQVAKSLVARSGSFAEGGFTGHGGKYEPAGTVHKGEVVFSQADVAALGGAQTVDAMRPTSKQNYYVGGIVGSVPQPVNSSAMLLDAIRQIRPVVTVQDINAVAQAEANRQQIAVI